METIEANTPAYQKVRIMKHQTKHFKSPKLSGMYTIEIPGLRLTYYIKTAKRYKAKFLALAKQYPEQEIICKLPKR
jgi:hypothetical protein